MKKQMDTFTAQVYETGKELLSVPNSDEFCSVKTKAQQIWTV